MSQNGVSNRMLATTASGGEVVVGAAAASPGGEGSVGLLDHNHNNHTTHSSSSMNHISSSQSAAASWSHSHVGSNQIANGLAISHSHQQQRGAGCTGAEYDAATAVMGASAAPQSPQSSSSSQTGTSLKEHDLLGLSEVSSSTTNNRLVTNSVQNSGAFHNQSDEELNLNLNLGSTELRLGGPQDAGSSGREGPVNEGHGGDQAPPPGDRRSATADQKPSHLQHQQHVLDRNCGYSALMGTGGGKGFLGSRAAADAAESTRRGPPLIEGESPQRWHSGGGVVDSGKFSSNEGSGLDLSLQQQRVRKGGIISQQEDGSEQKQLFLGTLSLERFCQEKGFAQSGKQRLVPEENIHQQHHRPLAYQESRPSWRERVEPPPPPQQHVGHRQEDVSSVERVGLVMGMGMSNQDRQQMVDGVGIASLDQQQQQGVQRLEDQQQHHHERVGHDAFQVEKRNLSEGAGGEALATPPPGRHLDYVTPPYPKLWQSPLLRPTVDVHGPQQPHPHPPQQQQDEIARSVFASGQLGGGGPFPPASRMMYAHSPAPPSKLGVTGAKRSFDTTGMISEARNFNDGRGGTGAAGCAGLPNSAAAVTGNSSAIISNSSSADHEKSRPHQVQQHQQVPSPLYHHQSPWSSDSKSGGATGTAHHPTWQMLHSGGSFGPFPYQAPGRNANMPPMEVAPGAAVAARAPCVASGGADAAHKPWEVHTNTITKTLHDPAAATSSCSTGQKQQAQPPILAEAKPSDGAATQVHSPCTEAASAPRSAPAPAPAPAPAAVGWPPLRNFRKGAIASRPSPVETNKPPICATPAAAAPPTPPPQAASPVSVVSHPNAWFVKVYMDGVPIGRKVDLKANCSYEKLSLILEDYFRGYVTGPNAGQSSSRDGGVALLPSDKRRFLHGSDYVLTYEDQEGDLMLVGDVPWTLFIDNVKRLRIMKGSEAIGLGARAAEKMNKAQPAV